MHIWKVSDVEHGGVYIPDFLFQPENIMLSDKNAEHPEIKIIDFGLAHRFEAGEEYKSLCGTPQYVGERETKNRKDSLNENK